MSDDPSKSSPSNSYPINEGTTRNIDSAEPISQPVLLDPQAVSLDPATTNAQPFAWKLVLVLLVVLLAAYMIAAPTIQLVLDQFAAKPKSSKLDEPTLLEQIRIHSMSGVVMLLFLAAGASIGSFLNVYIYRLPRYLPLLWPGSACPNCGYKIKGIDNLPILAWIGLRGRCRQCNVKISARYPAVEALVGAIFVLFFYRELLTGGKNLPVRDPNIYAGVVWIIFYTKWDLVCTYLIHMFVLVLLLGWCMINFDRFHVPKLSKISCVLFVLITAIVFPHLNPLTSTSQPIRPLDQLVSMGIPYQVVLAFSGGLIGYVGGWLMQRVFVAPPMISTIESAEQLALGATNNVDDQLSVTDNDTGDVTALPSVLASDSVPSASNDAAKDLYGCPSRHPNPTTDAGFSMLLVGIMFGPFAAITIMVIAIALHLLYAASRLIFRDRVWLPVTVSIFAATLIHLIVWRQIHHLLLSASAV